MTDPTQRWLRTLSCPFAFNVRASSPSAFQKAVNWLEDTHIRSQPPASRAPLRSLRRFPAALAPYIATLLPGKSLTYPRDATEILRALVRRALDDAFADDSHRLCEPVDPWRGRALATIPGIAKDKAVGDAVARLGRIVGDEGMDERSGAGVVDVMDATADVVCGGDGEGGGKVVLDELALGFCTGDDGVDRVSRMLRLLFVRDLRELQDRVNDAVARMQEVTGDARTDSRLGRVGR